MELAVVVRAYNEPYLVEFVSHYLGEGADHVFIFDDRSTGKYAKLLRALRANSRVSVVPRSGGGQQAEHLRELNRYYTRRIRGRFTWVAAVDADEFIVPRRNPESSLKNELRTTFRSADCVYVPWVMMAFNGRARDPDRLLATTDMRWNHDRRHPNPKAPRMYRCRYDRIEHKAVFRTSAFPVVHLHTPRRGRKTSRFVSGVDAARMSPGAELHPGIREADIASGHLLCYHYRMYSIEHARRKVQGANYLYGGGRRGGALTMLMSNDYAEVRDTSVARRVRVREQEDDGQRRQHGRARAEFPAERRGGETPKNGGSADARSAPDVVRGPLDRNRISPASTPPR